MSDTLDNHGQDDIAIAAGLLRSARNFFDVAQGAFDTLGYRTAAENLRRYRSGRGGTQNYTDEEIAAHPALLGAEDANRTDFEQATFTGRSENKQNNAKLLGLADGEEYAFEDYWQSRSALDKPSTYLAFGRNSVESTGGFLARRDGDSVMLRGTVRYGFIARERFDFNPGQPGH